jgi:hypothetical protein
MGPWNAYKDMLDNVISTIACVSMNHENQLEQMANEAMFATISPFLVIYDNTSKASINLQKLAKLEPLTLAWMLTPSSKLPLDQTSPRFDLLFLCSHISCLFHFGNTSLLWFHILPLWNKISKRSQNKMASRKLASSSKHSSKRNVKYKGESRVNHDSYV